MAAFLVGCGAFNAQPVAAGAMNAAVLADGHAKGGAAAARTALENFWHRVSEAARFSPLRRGPVGSENSIHKIRDRGRIRT
jgi:hypothetical protein